MKMVFIECQSMMHATISRGICFTYVVLENKIVVVEEVGCGNKSWKKRCGPACCHAPQRLAVPL